MAIQRVLWGVQTVGALLLLGTSAHAQFVPAPNPPYPFPFSLGGSPVAVVVGNFKAAAPSNPSSPLPASTPDLAVANQGEDTVSLLLSNGPMLSTGAGGYTLGVSFQVGKHPSAMAVADFNKDGYPDLVVTNQDAHTITILLSDPNGWANPPKNITLGPFTGGVRPDFVVVGDFDGDNKLDLAITNRDTNNVTVLKGDGNGGFTAFPGSPFAVGTSPSCIAAADFNGDGNLDLAVSNELDNTVTVLLGDGTGGFKKAIASPFGVGFNPSYIVAADFNGDGIQDLAIANLSSGNVTLLLGTGTGGFRPAAASPFSVGTNPFAMTVGDFNGDSVPDLAVANYGSNNVTVLLGDGTGGFKSGPGSPFAVGTSPRSLAVGDFNVDGVPDLVVANSGSGDVSMLLNTFTMTPVMVSAASYSPTAPVAPGSVVSIFGTGLSSLPALAAPISSPPQLPTCLNWIGVAMNDASGVKNIPLPLFYVSSTQIDAQIPQNVATGAATFTVSTSTAPNCVATPPSTSQTSASQKGTVTVATVAPGLFSANGNGKGVASGQFVANLGIGTAVPTASCPATGPCTANPLNVSSGTSILVLYGTGIHNRVNLSDVTVVIGAQTLPAFYAGSSPDAPGADQVNVVLPKSLSGANTVFVTVSIAGTVSNQVTVLIQ